MRAAIYLLSAILGLPLIMSAQTDKQKASIRLQRMNKVDFMHAAIGIEAGGKENVAFGPKVSYGIGSYRNLLNGEIGLGYMFYNVIGGNREERISLQQLPLFIDLHLNLYRWSTGGVYLGGEGAYYLNTTATHHSSDGTAERDSRLGKSHSTLGATAGVRLSQWDFSIRYVWDLAPMINQKLVFESEGYDYDYLHDSLFERDRLMLNVTYLLPF